MKGDTRLAGRQTWICDSLLKPPGGTWTSPEWRSWSSAPWSRCRWPYAAETSEKAAVPQTGRSTGEYRQLLGRSILLGLELLVAADIIRTVAVTPTFTSVGVLAVIVVIRTFLSFSLELEITGRWPWQKDTEPVPATGAA